MASLVGIYLVQADAFKVVRDGKTLWTGTWTLLRSPLMNRANWQFLVGGEALHPQATRALAMHAAEEEGMTYARDLQGDDGLEPMSIDDADIDSSGVMQRAWASGWC